MPAIFAHSGALSPHGHALEDDDDDATEGGGGAGLRTIHEGRLREATNAEADLFEAGFAGAEKASSLREQLQLMVIVQYGVLALHSTTHDQVFLSYLVSDYEAGGPNLNARHFSQLSGRLDVPGANCVSVLLVS
ncbi:hypothetical protein HGRIS_001430 [Hohenbuehelia grisea]|uniref:Uncharacterized protein n=1 Tax=Hohenbuehelia grisea TaxID=104357 RepID=A0ABR3JPA2_9AGAR